MNRRLFTAAGAAAALALAASSASATVIGGSSQSSQQGINSTQGANAPTATGDVIVVGVGAGPAGVQSSGNTEISGQAVGSAGGGDTFISPTGSGPTQSNQQGANSQQTSSNGAIGLQVSGNALLNSQIVGGDQSCAVPGAPCASSVVIGTPTQANEQGVNSGQSADGGVTTGDSITTPTVVINGLAGSASQFSGNATLSSQIVLG
ncbi:MAG TPA: hypothetical protein VFR49_09165 [Solirubrobacteraceae bacterium]|nr:hypothetical protein [Solirubrobacteraceae bacterium]